ncbi:MAG: hypothetical protein ACI96W_002398 [Paraglaciecola sp.]|jgi:hypothetical protein
MNEDQRLEQQSEQNVVAQEKRATNAVVAADQATAEQATGYNATTPEQAEQIARDAVIAADQAVAATE